MPMLKESLSSTQLEFPELKKIKALMLAIDFIKAFDSKFYVKNAVNF